MSREAKKQQQREKIISAAMKVFVEKGFAGATMAEIATEAGIGKGTIYGYFKSKDELFFALFNFTMIRYEDILQSAKERNLSAADSILYLNDKIVDHIIEFADMYSIFFEFWAATSFSEIKERFRAVMQEFFESFRDYIAMLIKEDFGSGEKAEHISIGIISLWDSIGFQYWLNRDMDIRGVSRTMTDIFIKGLKE
jgi:AcrR family transcriptional regulator